MKNDYPALDEWVARRTVPVTKVRTASENLPDFINDNDGLPFLTSPVHTIPLVK